MIRLIAMLALVASPLSAATAQTVPPLSDISMVDGACVDTTLGIADEKSPDRFEKTPFQCNAAVVSYHEARGSLMVTFTNKQASDNRLLGYAGTLTDREHLDVKRIYLAGGADPIVVEGGECQLFWNGRKIETIVCGARGLAEGKIIVPIVEFRAK